MVEKVIMAPHNVIDFTRYQAERCGTAETQAILARTCRHCGAVLLEDEREDECSSASNTATSRLRDAKKFYAD